MRHPFLRTLAGSGVTTDPNFENVTLLLHGDGTNGGQNNTFVDGSTNNFTITRNGNTTQGTFSPYGDNWSNFFDGVGDYLEAPSSSAFGMGTGDYTIEFWLYLTATPASNQIIVDFRSSTPATGQPVVYLNSSRQPIFYLEGSSNLITGSAISAATWVHIAVSKASGVYTLFINGTSAGTSSNSVSVPTSKIRVGADFAGSSPVNGYVSNTRIVKGTAVYTSAFTPSTIPLTAITNTSLLTCQSNRFRDASTNNFTITRNGDVSVQRFSPFSPTAAYAAGTIGGSGYFDGTGDSLTISSATGLCNFATGEAFTFQCWIYRAGTGVQSLIQGGVNTFQITALGSTGGFTYGKAGVSDLFFGVGACPLSTWTHVTLCRNTSNQSRMWVNGVSVASSSSDTYSFNAAATAIGSNSPPTANYVNGHLSDMRILKGQALYDPTSAANIAVPTAPLTAVANTSFLLNFQNAAILDNAMMAVPETVGNAQISTSVKKYGTGSLYFDGTGDYLAIPVTPIFNYGTESFTIELWFYAQVVSSSEIAIYRQHNSAGPFKAVDIRISSSKIVGVVVASATNIITGTTTLTTNTWYHVAFVRSGNVFTLYLNGTSEGTATDSGALDLPTTVRVAANQVNSLFFTGYIDDLRITKGVARYTANFTPPTAAFPDL